MNASDITKAATQLLAQRECFVWRNNNLAVRGRKFIGLKGVPDIVGFQKHTGIAVYCEVKTATDRLSEEQIEFLTRAKKAGCFCLMATAESGKVKLSEWVYD